MKYQIDKNTIWEDTGKVVLWNYPPIHKTTFSYITKIYKEYKRDRGIGYIEVAGEPIYLHDMREDLRSMCAIMGHAHNYIARSLPDSKEMNKLKHSEDLMFD
jgi:hypothetical protein